VIHGEKSAALAAVHGAIAEALISTAMGLFVAIPAAWAYNYLTTKLESFDIELNSATLEMVNYLTRIHSTRIPSNS
jgi:biopolymer transport protein ExbB/biopolymer transport protein TolQ